MATIPFTCTLRLWMIAIGNDICVVTENNSQFSVLLPCVHYYYYSLHIRLFSVLFLLDNRYCYRIWQSGLTFDDTVKTTIEDWIWSRNLSKASLSDGSDFAYSLSIIYLIYLLLSIEFVEFLIVHEQFYIRFHSKWVDRCRLAVGGWKSANSSFLSAFFFHFLHLSKNEYEFFRLRLQISLQCILFLLAFYFFSIV